MIIFIIIINVIILWLRKEGVLTFDLDDMIP